MSSVLTRDEAIKVHAFLQEIRVSVGDIFRGQKTTATHPLFPGLVGVNENDDLDIAAGEEEAVGHLLFLISQEKPN